MKTIITLLLSIAQVLWSFAQTNSIPGADLRDLNGVKISSTEIIRPGAATLLVFWKSNNSQCCTNLENMEAAWSESLQKQGVRMVVICTDCNGNWSSIKPVVNGNGWEFETYVDVNGDFKRAMNVNLIPHTFILNGKNEIVWQHTSFAEGNELQLIELVRKVKAGEEITE